MVRLSRTKCQFGFIRVAPRRAEPDKIGLNSLCLARHGATYKTGLIKSALLSLSTLNLPKLHKYVYIVMILRVHLFFPKFCSFSSVFTDSEVLKIQISIHLQHRH